MLDTVSNNSPDNRAARRTRQALLNAGLELIIEKGYDAVTVADIVRLADYGRSTFYVHFQDKEDLAWALLRYQKDELERIILEEALPLPSPQREFRAWELIFSAIDRQRGFFVRMDGELSRRLRQWQKDYVTESYEMQLEMGLFSLLIDVPPAIGARFIVGGLMDILDYWLDHPEAGTPTEMATLFFRLVFRTAPDAPASQSDAPSPIIDASSPSHQE